MIGRVAVLALLAGCAKAPSEEPPIGPPPPLDGAWQQITPFSGKTGGDGILEVRLTVAEGQSAFQITGSSAEDFVGVERLIDPDGNTVTRWQDWWYSDEALTDAFFGYARTVTFNWPVRAQDGPLQPGEWTVELYTARANGAYTRGRIAGYVWQKADADLGAGEVPVHIVYTRGQRTPAVESAIEGAVEEWTAIWAARGLELVPTYHDSDLDKNLDFAYRTHGGPEIEDYVAANLPPGELVLIVGETIDGDMDTFGLAGGIPGPLEATPFTWVLIGWLANAGVDGAFDAEEIRIMGETMAHEVGHFSGLYHPVDFDAAFVEVQSWDALADTEACTEWQGCEAAMADNLMYPYPVCDYYGGGGCTPANQITEDQGGVWHRYLGVR